jgi:hypothetical protein
MIKKKKKIFSKAESIELLRKQATVEAFTEWLDALVEQKVVKVRYSKNTHNILFRKVYFDNISRHVLH